MKYIYVAHKNGTFSNSDLDSAYKSTVPQFK